MSRAQDPQLHTHVVCANMARGRDGRWTALEGTAIYEHASLLVLGSDVAEDLDWRERYSGAVLDLRHDLASACTGERRSVSPTCQHRINRWIDFHSRNQFGEWRYPDTSGLRPDARPKSGMTWRS